MKLNEPAVGRGRGRHMTIPAWLQNLTSIESKSPPTNKQQQQLQTRLRNEKKYWQERNESSNPHVLQQHHAGRGRGQHVPVPPLTPYSEFQQHHYAGPRGRGQHMSVPPLTPYSDFHAFQQYHHYAGPRGRGQHIMPFPAWQQQQ